MEGIKIKEANVWGKSFINMCQFKILQQNARMLNFIFKIIAYSFHMQSEENRTACCKGCSWCRMEIHIQKSSYIKTLDTAAAQTDINGFPQVLPSAQSLLFIQKNPQWNDKSMLSLYEDFNIELAVGMHVIFSSVLFWLFRKERYLCRWKAMVRP